MLEPPGSLDQTPLGISKCLSEFLSGLTDHRPLGVAVSGGSDSLGLLYGLAGHVAPGKLFVLTVDHGLRAGSADEARQVKAHCRRLGVCHETLKWDHKQPASGLQAAARAARYRLLGAAAYRLGLAAVLTGHTRDDQQETLEMRRARSPSESAAGLAGIPRATLFDGRMWVLRPMLGLTRAEIRDFLREARVDWIEDPSNSDARFERVRVRRLLKQTIPDSSAPDGSAIAAVRSRLAGKAAACLEASCSYDADDMVRMRLRPNEDPDVISAAIEALIDLCGGAERPLDRRGKATLGEVLRGWAGTVSHNGNIPAITLGRTLIQCRGGDLLIRRERRGIDKLELGPSASGVWDGRYRIRNLDTKSVLQVSAGEPHGISPSFSRHLEGRMLHWTAGDGVVGGFLCQRLTGRSSRILPVHELPLAQALSALAGDFRFPECPWDVSAGNASFSAVRVR
ncbi:MAG: tRNA lysidine(34) synthetase TilS [Hoeflea sp.]|uniref:tRNA lysidine(34) synthetase TilS n=1 Tax=Hoeflea sp. TaxID=1940281 RepID=UPI001E1650AE|nr:tRNA lysidine(34) synthetase TilS [Hoeflea sp.]MBU4530758.1 tRNA lysidine(34) synthetase TilS [Alphaproteobacteria bacterium]MBU4544757.1 tRNA lysidine(34) synthetase TilS [Alphaproteobacteria bacterium]MBU4549313.1 tRNA lysidine(34) synthetase TilS [Alphaproteobacteria bacterium]MBV1726352.1 tRNA lysidine(34) synthetase TilS [Hoeflea sp.]MBV1761694.1 tRNA lysidine(34) synthetase TilS [Hoeflea sp.]